MRRARMLFHVKQIENPFCVSLGARKSSVGRAIEMRKILGVGVLAAAALAACAKKEDAAATEKPGAASPLDSPAAQLIDGDPASAWIELTGVWARKGFCDDDAERWVLESQSFSLYEMHCPIEKLQMLENGVKATSHCTVEGDDDGIEDAFYFIRQPDTSLTIVQGENNSVTGDLYSCDAEGETP